MIERAFRTLKSMRIKMEPMYHWLPKRIEAHVKLCVFSLLIERVAELKCKQPWPYIRRILPTLQATSSHPKKSILSAQRAITRVRQNTQIPRDSNA